MDVLVRGVRLLVKLARTAGTPLASLIVQDDDKVKKNRGFDYWLEGQSDEEIAKFVRERGETMCVSFLYLEDRSRLPTFLISFAFSFFLSYFVHRRYHPTSTVRMAPLEKGGCLDWNLLVHGTSNLRVADDSVLPNIVSGHTVSTPVFVFMFFLALPVQSQF